MPALFYAIDCLLSSSENPYSTKGSTLHYFSTSFIPFSGGISFIVLRNSFSSQHRT